MPLPNPAQTTSQAETTRTEEGGNKPGLRTGAEDLGQDGGVERGDRGWLPGETPTMEIVKEPASQPAAGAGAVSCVTSMHSWMPGPLVQATPGGIAQRETLLFILKRDKLG